VNIAITATMMLLFVSGSMAFRFYEPNTTTEATIKWYEYLSIDARVSMKFPGLYEEKKQLTANGTLISVKCISDDDQYMFSANVHAIPFPDPDATIKLIMDNNIRKYGATLVKESDFIYKTYKGKSSVFKDMSGTYFYRGLIINNIIYQMLVYTGKSDIMENVLSYFNSFDYKGPKK
jgi:hypothetical protein